MQRNFKLVIFALIVIVTAIAAFNSYDSQFQDTLEERTAYIQQQRPNAVIVSEITAEDCIVSELVDYDWLGYALFVPQNNQRLRFQGSAYSQSDLFSDTLMHRNGHWHKAFFCKKPDLDALEVIYVDDNGVAQTIRSENLQGKTMVVQEEPDLISAQIFVTWYDTAGNAYTE